MSSIKAKAHISVSISIYMTRRGPHLGGIVCGGFRVMGQEQDWDEDCEWV